MSLMSDKAKQNKLCKERGVSVVPGSDGEITDMSVAKISKRNRLSCDIKSCSWRWWTRNACS